MLRTMDDSSPRTSCSVAAPAHPTLCTSSSPTRFGRAGNLTCRSADGSLSAGTSWLRCATRAKLDADGGASARAWCCIVTITACSPVPGSAGITSRQPCTSAMRMSALSCAETWGLEGNEADAHAPVQNEWFPSRSAAGWPWPTRGKAVDPGGHGSSNLTKSDFSRARRGGMSARTDAVGEALQEARS